MSLSKFAFQMNLVRAEAMLIAAKEPHLTVLASDFVLKRKFTASMDAKTVQNPLMENK